MTYDAVALLTKKFKVELGFSTEDLIARWRRFIKEAVRVGGRARYKKCGCSFTPDGCCRGELNSMKKRDGSCLKPFKEPDLDVRLAEFVGVLFGDGSISREQRFVSLNKNANRDYCGYLVGYVEDLVWVV